MVGDHRRGGGDGRASERSRRRQRARDAENYLSQLSFSEQDVADMMIVRIERRGRCASRAKRAKFTRELSLRKV